jgi:hypothetical protein
MQIVAMPFISQIIHAFHDGFCHKPETTFGTVNDDVLALLDPKFKRANFCSIIIILMRAATLHSFAINQTGYASSLFG